MAEQSRLVVTERGFHETMKALRQLDPELRKQTRKEIRGAANVVRKAAIGNTPKTPPMSGWQTKPSTGGVGTNQHGISNVRMVRGGVGWIPWYVTPKHYKIDIGRQRRQLRKEEWNIARVVGLGASVQAFEFAGRKGGSNKPQTQQYLRNMGRFGKPGRALWEAWDKNRPLVDAAVRQAVEIAEAKVNAEMKRVN